jgi:hypothetical protein
MLTVDDEYDDDDDDMMNTRKTMKNMMMMMMMMMMTNSIDSNCVNDLNQIKLLIYILMLLDKFYLSIDQFHVYDVPIIAMNQSVLDRFYKKIQHPQYSFDNLTFVLDLVLV